MGVARVWTSGAGGLDASVEGEGLAGVRGWMLGRRDGWEREDRPWAILFST